MKIYKSTVQKLNFTFFGTPDISSNTLDILFSNNYIPSLIVTSPDKRSGRGMEIHETPVSIWAKEHNIECLKPEKIDSEFIEEFFKLNMDLSIVVAYGKILPEILINKPKIGTINIHYSLLPKYRGASPLESALLNGDTKTGVSIQQMAFKLDSGPILAEKEIHIDINETKEELKNKLIKLGGDLLCEIIPQIITKSIIPNTQDEEQATFCTKIKKEDGELNLNKSTIENYNKYRAFYGWPGVYFFHNKNGENIRVKIKKALYENNLFVIKRVTPEGKKEINYEDFLRQN
ncbi:MAG: methionyl-tRNA formyltransferase [Candidatus Nomurabacteria bacterium]|nr:methionyl-tRNA formyltransferase [Candidatus Nomurabacteria bacterium]